MKPPQFNYKVDVFINRHLGIRYWQKLLTPDSKQMFHKSLTHSAEHSHIHTETGWSPAGNYLSWKNCEFKMQQVSLVPPS